MLLPLSIILDELKYQYTLHLQENENPEFEWVNLLVSKQANPSNSYLQVCLLSEALDFSLHEKGIYYLCLRDRLVDSRETEQTLQGMIIINENIDLRELYNQIQNIFIKIKNWVMQMQQSIVDNKGYQDLFDLSEKIIGNHMHLLDPTFKLLAYTKNIDSNDPLSTELVQNGYHSEENVRKIQMSGRIELYKKQDDIIINKKCNVANVVTLERAFRCNNDFTAQAVLLFCRREFSRGQIDLFRIFTNYIKIYVDREYSRTSSNPYDSLIFDLIEGNITQETAIRDRAQYVHIPFKSNFNVYSIEFANMANVPANRVVQEVSNLLTSSKVIMYQGHIIALNVYAGKKIEELNHQNISKLQHLLKQYNGSCGISNEFECLLDLRTAFKQADIAIYIREKMSHATIFSAPSPWVEVKDGWIEINNRVTRFEDYYIYYMLDKCLTEDHQMFEMCFSIRALTTLQEYDHKHNVEYMKILNTFLMCESRASQTANLLHMHRNNVIYHINKIAELTGLDLDDPEVRIKLLIGFKTLELYSSRPQS